MVIKSYVCVLFESCPLCKIKALVLRDNNNLHCLNPLCLHVTEVETLMADKFGISVEKASGLLLEYQRLIDNEPKFMKNQTQVLNYAFGRIDCELYFLKYANIINKKKRSTSFLKHSCDSEIQPRTLSLVLKGKFGSVTCEEWRNSFVYFMNKYHFELEGMVPE